MAKTAQVRLQQGVGVDLGGAEGEATLVGVGGVLHAGPQGPKRAGQLLLQALQRRPVAQASDLELEPRESRRISLASSAPIGARPVPDSRA